MADILSIYFLTDQEFHQLVKSWLLMITCTEPVITKAFEVRQLVGGGAGSNKVIGFLFHWYQVEKSEHQRLFQVFILSQSLIELISFYKFANEVFL